MKRILTIVTPYYNFGKKITDRLIQSVISLRHSDRFTWIIFDDCSEKKYVKYLKTELEKTMLSYKLISRTTNLGPDTAYSEGSRMAQTPFVVFLDGDDTLSNNFLDI